LKAEIPHDDDNLNRKVKNEKVGKVNYVSWLADKNPFKCYYLPQINSRHDDASCNINDYVQFIGIEYDVSKCMQVEKSAPLWKDPQQLLDLERPYWCQKHENSASEFLGLGVCAALAAQVLL
jgi:hypothetical protein